MSSAPTLHKFAVWAPDTADGLQRRLAVRPTHLEDASKLFDDGKIKIGGALLTPESITTGEKKFFGSFMVFEAESLDAVRKIVESDVYYANNVWDKEKILIMPWAQGYPPA